VDAVAFETGPEFVPLRQPLERCDYDWVEGRAGALLEGTDGSVVAVNPADGYGKEADQDDA
jgi:hypothetical protein